MQATVNKLFFRAVLGMVALVMVFGVLVAGNADIEEIKQGPPVSTAVTLEAGLDNPIMARAYEQLRSEGALGSEFGKAAGGATYTFPTRNGPVELTQFDLNQLNARYRKLRGR